MTRNFSISEFECSCGCKMPDKAKENIVILANQLQKLRDFVKKPIIITNAYRCEKHNKSVGGVKNSQHLSGKAADIKVVGLSPIHVSNAIEGLIKSKDILQGGVGIYDTFTHYDHRGTTARWDFRKK